MGAEKELDEIIADFVPPSSPTDEQMGRLVRSGLCTVVDLMAEETHGKLLGLPRYEQRILLSPVRLDGFDLRYGIYCMEPSRHPKTNEIITVSRLIGACREKHVCELIIKLLNARCKGENHV